MRELHADRSDADGTHIIVMDLESGEEFQIPIDSMLRTLIHPPEPVADVADPPEDPTDDAHDSASDEPAVESTDESTESAPLESVPTEAPPAKPAPAEVAAVRTLTPREIQARVRAGATVAELAEATGVSEDKINRFAHPVILERSRAAELARASHPMGIDGPTSWTLGELVAECLVLRGSTPQNAVWDAWRTESGQWVVQVAPDPDEDVYAHWRFTLGSHGGTTDPMDDLAVELTEPDLARSYRRPTVVPAAPEPLPVPEPPTREVSDDGHEFVTVNADDVTDQQRRRGQGLSEVLDLRYDDDTEVQAPTKPAEKESTTPRHRGKRATPTVPAWEDVLLGVRSHPNE
ncbi:septation protein SepH [Gordonia phthalatica]|uniref:DUF3071 domain-containing protein n=1 Tax=Gordonia phthalatica TaxID=1136941 RepID=A0A0N9MZX0_9ACTN|nr:septation protein SepH [Gordonia phthalatica]ALG83806.1 hypothetical protein ACH46_03905 [Gordonia phthalatica]